MIDWISSPSRGECSEYKRGIIPFGFGLVVTMGLVLTVLHVASWAGVYYAGNTLEAKVLDGWIKIFRYPFVKPRSGG